jgi:hypothetical protein
MPRATHSNQTEIHVVPANKETGTPERVFKARRLLPREAARLEALCLALSTPKSSRRPASCRGGAADFSERYGR